MGFNVEVSLWTESGWMDLGHEGFEVVWVLESKGCGGESLGPGLSGRDDVEFQ